ncbi:hypothetical protein G1H10_19060 [Phytoactinopolyspora halotolerans]|uniref:Ceramidase n=1 Tax=Phytoactinopolyspora halotolerans TaxID=1981512 RepID=A0A6L9SAV4_9ACTN|nr:hypothetical protein [Phytoactinopolyspora halotolerans]
MNDCEVFGDGFWGQPVNALTSLAFVLVGLAILIGYRRGGATRVVYGALVAATGVGSVVFHGPAPSWSGLLHDVPLVALVAFVGVDAASDVAGRRLSPLWWVLPTIVAVTVSEIADAARPAAQGAVAALAIGACVVRWYRRPLLRQTMATALALLTVGALIGTLSRSGGPLCDPDSVLQGHAFWHVLAALAVWTLTPVISERTGSVQVVPQDR